MGKKTEFVGVYHDHEGSTYELDSGNYLTCFPAGDDGDLAATETWNVRKWFHDHRIKRDMTAKKNSKLGDYTGFTKVYEYDASGAEIASVTAPYYETTPYRATPFSTINGETMLFRG